MRDGRTVTHVLTTDARTSAALEAIAATEATGNTMTAEQFYELQSAIYAQLTARPPLPAGTEHSFTLPSGQVDTWPGGRDDDLEAWIWARELLVVRRGAIDSPTGKHGPFPGTRCVYCYSNDLDIELYTLDPLACPPSWACGGSYPGPEHDLRWLHCQLAPDHDGDHQCEQHLHPEAYSPEAEAAERADAAKYGYDLSKVDPDTIGLVPAEGPSVLRVHTWPRAAA